jgi:hypothetical protein
MLADVVVARSKTETAQAETTSSLSLTHVTGVALPITTVFTTSIALLDPQYSLLQTPILS